MYTEYLPSARPWEYRVKKMLCCPSGSSQCCWVVRHPDRQPEYHAKAISECFGITEEWYIPPVLLGDGFTEKVTFEWGLWSEQGFQKDEGWRKGVWKTPHDLELLLFCPDGPAGSGWSWFCLTYCLLLNIYQPIMLSVIYLLIFLQHIKLSKYLTFYVPLPIT